MIRPKTKKDLERNFLQQNANESNKKELFNFLKFVLDLREGGSQPNSPIKSSSRWKDEDVLSLNETYETYVELMAEFEPRRVAAYLKSKVSRYRNQKVLKICQKFHLGDRRKILSGNWRNR